MALFTKLGLSGGGAKGILHVGALLELQKHIPLKFPDGIYGSSIGSVIATCVSFNVPIDDKFVNMTKQYLTFDKIVPKPSFNDLRAAFQEKGVFSMELFEKTLINFFGEYDIDIVNKKIGDADQPLNIIASNVTKGVSTIFTKDVPILDALKCSCCIPGVFRPQILYDQVYVDGDVFIPCISLIQPDALCLFLEKHVTSKVTPQNIGNISAFDFVMQMYTMSKRYMLTKYKRQHVISLYYPNLHHDSELEGFDMDDILLKSRDSVRTFLASKGLLQELPKIDGVGSSNHLV